MHWEGSGRAGGIWWLGWLSVVGRPQELVLALVIPAGSGPDKQRVPVQFDVCVRHFVKV